VRFPRGEDHGLEGLDGGLHLTAEVFAEDLVQRAGGEVLSLEAGEACRREVRRLEDERLRINGADALEVHDRIARQDPELGGDRAAGLRDAHREDLRDQAHAAGTERLAVAEEPVEVGLDPVPGYERAPSLVAGNEPALFQLAERLAERRPADHEVTAQLSLRGQSIAGRPLTAPDSRLRLTGDPGVKRLAHDRMLSP
jgi:hypothetical protein